MLSRPGVGGRRSYREQALGKPSLPFGTSSETLPPENADRVSTNNLPVGYITPTPITVPVASINARLSPTFVANRGPWLTTTMHATL